MTMPTNTPQTLARWLWMAALLFLQAPVVHAAEAAAVDEERGGA